MSYDHRPLEIPKSEPTFTAEGHISPALSAKPDKSSTPAGCTADERVSVGR